MDLIWFIISHFMSKQKKKKKKSFYEFEKGHTHICVCVLYLRFIKTIIGKTSQKKKNYHWQKKIILQTKKKTLIMFNANPNYLCFTCSQRLLWVFVVTRSPPLFFHFGYFVRPCAFNDRLSRHFLHC